MASSMKLSVRFTESTLEEFNEFAPYVPWGEVLNHVLEDHVFQSADPPLRVFQLAGYIETFIVTIFNERLYQLVEDTGQLEMQIGRLQVYESDKDLAFEDNVSEHLKPGDTVIADAQAMLVPRQREYTPQDIENFRRTLRFDLNDRVLCNCGPRWISGHIVGTAVPQDDELLPYLVKTDPLPGLPSSTISVPYDDDKCCTQEICFDPNWRLHLVKAAAAVVSDSNKPKLRFAVGDKIVCRIRNDHKDDLEQWVPGVVSLIWPELPGDDETWDMGDASGKFPNVVPYKIDLTYEGAVHMGGWIYCHRDDHTLIRRQGMEPQTRVRGVSKRIEVRKLQDGYEEQIDHLTERSKRVMTMDSSDSD